MKSKHPSIFFPEYISNADYFAKDSCVKGSPITKALTCMNIYLYKPKWQFCQGD